MLMLWCCVWLPITYLCKQRFYPFRHSFDVLRFMWVVIFCFQRFPFQSLSLSLSPTIFVFIHHIFFFLLFVLLVLYVCCMCACMLVWLLLSLFECDRMSDGGQEARGGDTFLWNSINFGNLKNWFVKPIACI